MGFINRFDPQMLQTLSVQRVLTRCPGQQLLKQGSLPQAATETLSNHLLGAVPDRLRSQET